ncbi:MAG TPA: hypothetical protein PKL78_01405 [Anaerolineales bacterium]|nr:hypothetical protein [Anaerolineales bacterium]HNN12183.1 hypothetical protein [Anaerolineales bacterium]HNO30183.1 hypothetical protein [Anaerolineales bacterium]
MTYQIKHLEEEDLVYVRFQGKVQISNIQASIVDVIAVAKRAACPRILIDLQEAQSQVSIPDLYALPDFVADRVREAGGGVRILRAFVVSQWQKDMQFYEDTSHNRGQHTKVFNDLESAKAWLKQ